MEKSLAAAVNLQRKTHVHTTTIDRPRCLIFTYVTAPFFSFLRPVHLSLQGTGECRHDVEPGLFHHHHFVIRNEIHKQHAVVVQANGATRGEKVQCGIVRFRIRIRSLALSSSDMNFGKDTTAFGEGFQQVDNHNRSKRSLS